MSGGWFNPSSTRKFHSDGAGVPVRPHRSRGDGIGNSAQRPSAPRAKLTMTLAIYRDERVARPLDAVDGLQPTSELGDHGPPAAVRLVFDDVRARRGLDDPARTAGACRPRSPTVPVRTKDGRLGQSQDWRHPERR